MSKDDSHNFFLYYQTIDWDLLWRIIKPIEGFGRIVSFQYSSRFFDKIKPVNTIDELKQQILNEKPPAIHIGGCISKSGEIKCEIRFDYDLNDKKYGFGSLSKTEIRTCCGDSKKICSICWHYAIFAIKFIKEVITEWWGLDKKDVYTFFSGQKGIHIFIVGKSYDIPSYVLQSLYKSLDFENFMKPQNFYYQKKAFGLARYHYDCILDGLGLKFKTKELSDINMLELMYPKFDKGVFNIDHLIRLPFSIHPVTGKINQLLKGTYELDMNKIEGVKPQHKFL